MILSDILLSTFHLRIQASGVVQYGTGFAMNMDGEEFLVTARHLMDAGDLDLLQIYQNKVWHTMPATVIGRGRGEVDVAVVKVGQRLSTSGTATVFNSGGITIGQDLFFLGFPYMLHGDLGPAMFGLPAAYARKGMLSSMQTMAPGPYMLFVDAMNNPGFSGGPLFFTKTESGRHAVHVIGVVSKFRVEPEPVLDAYGKPTGMTVKYNTGILVSYDIKHAQDLVTAHREKLGAPGSA